MSRQRDFQRKWEMKGRCGVCAEHPPIYMGGKCKSCYGPHKRQRFGSLNIRMISDYTKRIANHKNWIRKYERKIESLKNQLEKGQP